MTKRLSNLTALAEDFAEQMKKRLRFVCEREGERGVWGGREREGER